MQTPDNWRPAAESESPWDGWEDAEQIARMFVLSALGAFPFNHDGDELHDNMDSAYNYFMAAELSDAEVVPEIVRLLARIAPHVDQDALDATMYGSDG